MMTTVSPAPLAEPFYRRVQDRLRRTLQREGHDGLLMLATGNVIYATGFFHSANERPVGAWVPVDGEPILFVPLLEKENAEDGWIADVRTYDEFPGVVHPVLWMLGEIGRRRVAVDTLPVKLLDAARDGVAALAVTDLVERQRYVKEPEELLLTRTAARYADLCLEAILSGTADIVRGGGTELDILAHGMGTASAALSRDHAAAFGRTKLGITGTVHTGPRGALPHGKVIARRPSPGETMIAGIGASLGGYHAESGATFVLGDPNADQRRCLDAMQASNDAAIAALRPGAACTAVNDAALEPIKAAGLGDTLRHRIGHGMGIEGHEAPWLAPGDVTVVAPGMVFSNEPGIYRPGIDGYRTITSMIVGENGVEVPSRFIPVHPWEKRVITL
ncbi:Xaa-Pro peptidase family protein [uncultured Alsobacter sp.]|uniref:M24 family metallopeptidase n=1 Tax=uncultured Alsobacter sp. TaxID=1748258 RepID=UPI0025D410A3|nr:Xaa-Pro peptidase family protein [uncultured Alsobacter sp.]